MPNSSAFSANIANSSYSMLPTGAQYRRFPRECRGRGGVMHIGLEKRKDGLMTSRPLSAVVLAAGEGTRMRSNRPKPLHQLCGRPMVLHVLDALAELDIARVV